MTLETKLKALAAYETEMRAWPHARSVKALEHLAHWRGAHIGVEAAEAFMLGGAPLCYKNYLTGLLKMGDAQSILKSVKQAVTTVGVTQFYIHRDLQ